MSKKPSYKLFLGKLKNKYRLVLLNEETFEEVSSFRLSRMSVYVAVSSAMVIFGFVIFIVLAFTPLKYYIPGYGSLKQRQEYIKLNMQVDSLEHVLIQREKYLGDVKKVLRGEDFDEQLDTTQLRLPDVGNSTN